MNRELNRMIRSQANASLSIDSFDRTRWLFMQVYILRGCMSENMRVVMGEGRTPALPMNFFRRGINDMIWTLSEYVIQILGVTNHTPYVPIFNPYIKWIERG